VAAEIKLLLGPLNSNLHQVGPIDMVGTEPAGFEKMVDSDFFQFGTGALFQVAGNQTQDNTVLLGICGTSIKNYITFFTKLNSINLIA